MIRALNRSVLIRSNVCHKRFFSSSVRAFNVKTDEKGAPGNEGTGDQENNGKQNHKKGWSITGLLFRTALVGTVLYGGTLYVATKNDKILDFVIDKQPPYYEELLNFIENFSVEEVKTTAEKFRDSISQWKLPSKDKFDELTHKGGSFIEETKKKLASPSEDKQTELDMSKKTPAEQLQKPVETVQKTVEHLPLIKVNLKDGTAIDSTVQNTIQSFNDLIRSIDQGSGNSSKSDTYIKAVSDSVTKLANKLNELTTNFDQELQSKLKISQTELLASYTKKELELTENILNQFNHEKAQLEKKLNARLAQEIQATKESLSQAAVNAITMVRVEQIKKFKESVRSEVESERNGKLANLDKLNARITDLENFATSLESSLSTNYSKSLLQRSVVKLRSLLDTPEDGKPELLAPYVDDLDKKSASLNDELITLAIKELRPLLAKESTHSVLTNSQLLGRWEQLSPELRSASLLPPNAGLLGHLASLIFSKLLLPVKGSNPEGKDIESVIARVESNLARNNLDDAVEEAANLKAFTRKLADDWVIEARKRLEVQYLLSIIEAESKIL
ncbi:Piso0_005861 [Millerozyma farinosa CBS 7064]|uniref:MICOS complex subunit MIC60 n=1 Tax=Pichia sorbitophila (strain ATCC MYA-4447 / BCRC 22081 / CBS 7064 / NBRC 10061 / NRRL Y-12695) TaxID=559304 RepID=G8Y343_PICSO|nr:Piso0_005861 [Millerozyma farinosa CBS 7064]